MSKEKDDGRRLSAWCRNSGASGKMYIIGRSAGRRWAVQDATPLQMSRLASVVVGRTDQLFEGRVSLRRIAADLYEVIVGHATGPSGVEAFWRKVLGEADPIRVIEDRRYAAGFVDGVLDVWLGLQGRHDPEDGPDVNA